MNLYRKYRPQTLADMYGNEAELESFEKILARADKPQTYLLTGPSGCGKTTLARIAARQLGADDLSITEINSADNRGIDTARDIIQNMRYQPPTASAKVYIIDEFHQVSKAAQEALLKPLEDTPSHVYFFICTTNPSKVINAIKTRCTQIKLNALKPELLYRLVKRICKKEGYELSKDILEDLCDNCNGSPRTALVLLEKICELTDEKTMQELIQIGEEADADVIELCRALLNEKNWKPVADALRKLQTHDIEKIRYAVLGYMNSVLTKNGKNQVRAACVIDSFKMPFYDSGKAGLALACYESLFAE